MKTNIDHLIQALEVSQYYNEMSFDEFANELEEHYDITINKSARDRWKFKGLINTDFLINIYEVDSTYIFP